MKDLNIILISDNSDYFKDFSAALEGEPSLKLNFVTSATELLELVGANGIDVVVAAENSGEVSGLEVIKQVVMKNPFINTALVSPLPHEEFHDVTEGLGVFLQIPPEPGQADAEKFREYLTRLY